MSGTATLHPSTAQHLERVVESSGVVEPCSVNQVVTTLEHGVANDLVVTEPVLAAREAEVIVAHGDRIMPGRREPCRSNEVGQLPDEVIGDEARLVGRR